MGRGKEYIKKMQKYITPMSGRESVTPGNWKG